MPIKDLRFYLVAWLFSMPATWKARLSTEELVQNPQYLLYVLYRVTADLLGSRVLG
jgi:hypothetical protein